MPIRWHDFLPVFVEEIGRFEEGTPAELVLYDVLCGRKCWQTTDTNTHQQNQSGLQRSNRWWGGSGISWTTCKSTAPRSRQITTPAPHRSIFLQARCSSCHPTNQLSQPTASKHWRHYQLNTAPMMHSSLQQSEESKEKINCVTVAPVGDQFSDKKARKMSKCGV